MIKNIQNKKKHIDIKKLFFPIITSDTIKIINVAWYNFNRKTVKIFKHLVKKTFFYAVVNDFLPL